jgi:NAD(P)-dependent dehydrogenase (short-subunit alcohol dehydrogenase family)
VSLNPLKSRADAWSLSEMPDQSGRTILVTGVTRGGLGHYTALELARRGARVVLAGRNPDKIDDTEQAIRGQVQDADLGRLVVDLADLTSVRRAAAKAGSFGPIHVLVNNAGVMATPYQRTVDNLEMQMATNHFGPFLLTGLLLPQLVASEDARVVAVSSQMHRVARKAPLEDPHAEPKRYSRWPVYSESKLANLLFTYELDRRCREAELPVRGLAAHPGFSGTHLAANGRYGGVAGGKASILDAAIKAVSQSAHAGALPTLMAATADLPGGTYCGPSGPGEYAGLPVVVSSRRLAHDESAQRELWAISERTTGIEYP